MKPIPILFKIFVIAIFLLVLFQSIMPDKKTDKNSKIDNFIHVEKLSDRVIVVKTGVTYFDAVTAIATKKGIVMVDAGISPNVTRKYRNIIEEQFNRSDFIYLINTHSHWDHTNGNEVFSDAIIIGHESFRGEMIDPLSDKSSQMNRCQKMLTQCAESLSSIKTNSDDWKQLTFRYHLLSMVMADLTSGFDFCFPEMTFDDRLTLDLEDVTLEIINFGKAHSGNDIIIFIPEENLVLSGDLFNKGGGGNLSKLNHQKVVKTDIDQWYKTLSFLMGPGKKIERIIDGHGVILSKKDLLKFYETVKRLWIAFNNGRGRSAKARLSQILEESGLEAMRREYLKLRTTHTHYFYEGEFIDFGYHLLQDNKTVESIEIFKINVEENPTSWNAYDSLGEAYNRGGNIELAKKNYEISLKLNPKNKNAKNILRKIKEDLYEKKKQI